MDGTRPEYLKPAAVQTAGAVRVSLTLFAMPAPQHTELLQRQRLLGEADPPHQAHLANAMLRLLLHQDGSTTRLLEAMTGSPLRVHVVEQALVRKLPSCLSGSLPGETFLRRLTTLSANGSVLLDSIAYIAVEALPRDVLDELRRGVRPIGHLLERLWTRRQFRKLDGPMLEELWASVGSPDPRASRSTMITTPEGPCMVLGETFRRGVLHCEARSGRAAALV